MSEKTIGDFVDEVKQNFNVEDLNKRIGVFKSIVLEHINDPWKFNIIGDAYWSFYDVPNDDQYEWIKFGTHNKKCMITTEEYPLLDFEEMALRVTSFARVLFYSGAQYKDPFYKYVGSYMLYVFSGIDLFLEDSSFAPYMVPPQPKNEPTNKEPDEGAQNGNQEVPQGMYG